MFVRKKKNRSGSTSVVVGDKSLGKFTELKTIGVATSEEDISDLVVRGKDWIAHYDGTVDYLRHHFKDDVSLQKIYRYLDKL